MRRVVAALVVSSLALAQTALSAPSGASTVTISAAPNPVVFGSSTTIAGQVTGKHNAGVTVSVESKPFPYTSGFKTVATTKTDATGHYTFKVAPTLNTVYHVVAKASPTATSPDVTVRVRVGISLRVGTSRPAAGQRVRFSGFVLPAYNGKTVQIQRKTATGWKTVARVALAPATPLGSVARSKYSRRLRIRSSGTYRVLFDPADGARIANTTGARKLTVH